MITLFSNKKKAIRKVTVVNFIMVPINKKALQINIGKLEKNGVFSMKWEILDKVGHESILY